MHSNEMTLEQAATFASTNTPRGWLRLDAATVRGEQHLYLQQPTYGTSYVIGKIEVGAASGEGPSAGAEWAKHSRLREFMDGVLTPWGGLIPVSLVALGKHEVVGGGDPPRCTAR
jgi:hypothetical protein